MGCAMQIRYPGSSMSCQMGELVGMTLICWRLCEWVTRKQIHKAMIGYGSTWVQDLLPHLIQFQLCLVKIKVCTNTNKSINLHQQQLSLPTSRSNQNILVLNTISGWGTQCHCMIQWLSTPRQTWYQLLKDSEVMLWNTQWSSQWSFMKCGCQPNMEYSHFGKNNTLWILRKPSTRVTICIGYGMKSLNFYVGQLRRIHFSPTFLRGSILDIFELPNIIIR
mmetsp:Transcript_36402/g.74217  ORF Transcript_36402/g.74217 Transcript_36402/m.74217 type:complete len:221 (-) Transcript_36402:3031-3693(-)